MRIEKKRAADPLPAQPRIIVWALRQPKPAPKVFTFGNRHFRTDTKTDTNCVKTGIAGLCQIMLDSLVKSAILNCFRGDNSPIPTLASSSNCVCSKELGEVRGPTVLGIVSGLSMPPLSFQYPVVSCQNTLTVIFGSRHHCAHEQNH